MTDRNIYGLSRTIPGEIRRTVRQRCGYGCLRCGLALFDYEHFDPEFKDATEHKAEGITLLCMQCNQKKRRRMLSAETVRIANGAPKCKEQGFASETFDFGPDPLVVAFGGVTFTDTATLVEINGFPVLSLQKPEEGGAPYRLSGLFSDSAGQTTLKIEENVWSAGAENWDVECIGPRITVRSGPRDIALVLKAEPPQRLVVERLRMEFKNVHMVGNEGVLNLSLDGRGWTRWVGDHISGCQVGMSLQNRRA